MPQYSSKLDLKIVRGDAFEFSITLTDNSENLKFQLLRSSAVNRTLAIQGDYTAAFTAGRLFVIKGNEDEASNTTYEVSSSSYASGTGLTTITVAANANDNIASVNAVNNTISITGDVRIKYAPAGILYVTGNTLAAANREYSIRSSTYNGTSTVIETVQDIPASAANDGTIVVPAISPRITNTGYLQPVASVPINISAYTIESDIRTAYNGDLLVSFTVTKSDTVTGKFTLSLTANETGAIPKGISVYDILITPSAGLPYRIPGDGGARINFVDAVTQ
jgi:hypothetical protein